MIEYPFDTTRAAVNLLFSGALERFPNIRFILSHAGGTLPFLAWRLSVAPMIDKRLKQRTREEIFAGLKTFWYDNALASGAAPMGALSRIAATERIVFGSDWPFCNDRVVTEEVADFTAPDFLPSADDRDDRARQCAKAVSQSRRAVRAKRRLSADAR